MATDDLPIEDTATPSEFPEGANGINLQIADTGDHMMITMFLNGQRHGWVEYNTAQLDELISDLLMKRAQMVHGQSSQMVN